MIFSIIISEKDIAGMTIRDSLLEKIPFVKTNQVFHNIPVHKLEEDNKTILLYTITQDSIYFESPENEIETDYFIFATRHSSKSGEKTLSVHFPGNFGKADFGGQEKELCVAPSELLKQAFINLNKFGKDSGFSVTLEATHHGPLIKKPVMFIEIGSQENEWKNKEAGNIIAKTIIETVKKYKKKDYETAIGFGGPHYCANFNKIELDSNIALSHICPKFNAQFLTKNMVQKMISSTYEQVDYALIDWKGLSGKDKNNLIKILEELKLRWKKTKEVK